MSRDPNSPSSLLSVANEIEAAGIVTALAGYDIEASTVGGFTAGYKAKALAASRYSSGARISIVPNWRWPRSAKTRAQSIGQRSTSESPKLGCAFTQGSAKKRPTTALAVREATLIAEFRRRAG